MQNNNHKFILTPISNILKDAVTACRGIGEGIETVPLREYLFQTVFLKLTGASEQKLKCICWEMATYDYNYRYQTISRQIGECSCYDEKKSIFQDLSKVISGLNPHYDFNALFMDRNKEELLDVLRNDYISILDNSQLAKWENRAFHYFKTSEPIINKNSFAIRNKQPSAKFPYTFTDEKFKKYYEDIVYRHRNRYAHNLTSYQNNIPTLKVLSSEGFMTQNCFDMMFSLIVFDHVFMIFFSEFILLLEKGFHLT